MAEAGVPGEGLVSEERSYPVRGRLRGPKRAIGANGFRYLFHLPIFLSACHTQLHGFREFVCSDLLVSSLLLIFSHSLLMF